MMKQRPAFRSLLLLGGMALMSGACTQQLVDRDITSSVSSDYRVNHPIRIVEGRQTIELFVGSGRGGLSPEQRAQVASFAGMWRRDSSGVLYLEVPAGTPNELAARATAREIHSVLSAYGVPASAVVTRAARPPGIPEELPPIVLSFGKVEAKVGQCGLWPDDLGPTASSNSFENRPYHNFGCATQNNLAAMVANPEDLIQPRPETPPMAARRQTVLDKYAKGENPSTKYDSKTEANVSKAVDSQ